MSSHSGYLFFRPGLPWLTPGDVAHSFVGACMSD